MRLWAEMTAAGWRTAAELAVERTEEEAPDGVTPAVLAPATAMLQLDAVTARLLADAAAYAYTDGPSGQFDALAGLVDNLRRLADTLAG